MLTLDPEELYSHLENNNVDIHYIRKLFNNDKKVNSSLLVNSILNDKNNIILNTNDENLYDENLKEYELQGYQRDNQGVNTQFYQVISIENDSLTYIAYTTLGKEYDRAIIKKDHSNGKKVLIE